MKNVAKSFWELLRYYSVNADYSVTVNRDVILTKPGRVTIHVEMTQETGENEIFPASGRVEVKSVNYSLTFNFKVKFDAKYNLFDELEIMTMRVKNSYGNTLQVGSADGRGLIHKFICGMYDKFGAGILKGIYFD